MLFDKTSGILGADNCVFFLSNLDEIRPKDLLEWSVG